MGGAQNHRSRFRKEKWLKIVELMDAFHPDPQAQYRDPPTDRIESYPG